MPIRSPDITRQHECQRIEDGTQPCQPESPAGELPFAPRFREFHHHPGTGDGGDKFDQQSFEKREQTGRGDGGAAFQGGAADGGRTGHGGQVWQGGQHAQGKRRAGCGPGQCAFDKRGDLGLQQLTSARQPLPHHVLRQFQDGGHPFHRLLLPVKEHQRFPIGVRDSFQRTPQNTFLLPADGLAGGIGGRGGGRQAFIQRFGGGKGIAGLLAEGAVDEVSGNAIEPGPELGGFLEIAEFAPGDEKGFLGEILAAGQIATGAVREGADSGLMAVHEAAKSLAIAGPAQFDQPGVFRYIAIRHDSTFHTRLRSGLK